jgi:hypothetical protein
MKVANLSGQENIITEFKLEKVLNMRKMGISNNNLIMTIKSQQLIGKTENLN